MMRPTDTSNCTPDDFDQIVTEYIDRLNAGKKLSPFEILAAHPENGAEILRNIQAFVSLESDTNEPLGTLGDYTLRRQIGRGGMGVVYEAWQGSVERDVALKVLPAGVAADDKAFHRFMREAKTAAKLSHPNVVSVYAMGVDDHTPYYAMELVEGETLAQVLASTREAEVETDTPFGKKDCAAYFEELARAFADVASGLQHAHSKGVTHRDIKPSNLILDVDGRLRILDFGLACLEGQESLTLSGDFVGTPLYMSPEQARRKKIKVDHRTDIYSLGATMYEAICGRPPFRGKNHADTLSQIVERDPTEPRKVNPRVPKDLQTIVLKCLRKDSGARFGTAEALLQDLQRFVRGDPIEANPDTAIEKFARTLWRHRVMAGAALAVLIITAVVCGVSAVLIHGERIRTQQAYEEEKKQREQADENFELARDAVDRVLMHLDSRIADVPGVQKIRQALLQEALGFYERFLQRKEDDAAVRFEVARALLRVGEIHDLLGGREKADEAYMRAVASLNRLAEEFPSTLKYRSLLAETHRKRGGLYLPTGDCETAEESFRFAVGIERDLVDEASEDAEYLRRLAHSLAQLARVLSCRYRYIEADEMFQQARELLDRLNAGSTLDVGLRQQLSDLLNWEGTSFFRRGELAKAKDLFEAGVRHLEDVAGGHFRNRTHRHRLVGYYDGLSIVLHRLGQREEERTVRRKRLAVSRALVAEDPEVPYYRSQYIDALKDHAALLYRTGRLAESEEPFREALAQAEALSERFPDVTNYRQLVARTKVQFAQALIALDRPGEAEEVLRSAWPEWLQLVQSSPSASGYVSNLELTSSLLVLLLEESGRWDELERHFDEARRFLDELLAARAGEVSPLEQSALYSGLARLLTEAPAPFRDPRRAVSLAEKAVEAVGTQGCYLIALGMAYYRNGQWQEAMVTLRRALEVGDTCSGARFFLAMAYWQQGEHGKAAEWFKEAVEWTQENDAANPDLARLHEEAQALLGR